MSVWSLLDPSQTGVQSEILLTVALDNIISQGLSIYLCNRMKMKSKEIIGTRNSGIILKNQSGIFRIQRVSVADTVYNLKLFTFLHHTYYSRFSRNLLLYPKGLCCVRDFSIRSHVTSQWRLLDLDFWLGHITPQLMNHHSWAVVKPGFVTPHRRQNPDL